MKKKALKKRCTVVIFELKEIKLKLIINIYLLNC